jgi:hypothetical protein
MQIYRPPIFGGGYFGTISIFESLLEAELPLGVKISPLKVVDLIDQTIGCCERQVRQEFFWLINPIYWAYALLRGVFQFPFHLVQRKDSWLTKFTDKVAGYVAGAIVFVLALVIVAWFLKVPNDQVRKKLGGEIKSEAVDKVGSKPGPAAKSAH